MLGACIHYSSKQINKRNKVTLQCFPSLIFSDMNIQLHDYKRSGQIGHVIFTSTIQLKSFSQDFPSLLLIFFLNIEYIFIILALT